MVSWKNIKVGEELPPYTFKMDSMQYKKYNKLVSEVNPIHFDEKFAKSLGYKAIVVAGVFTCGFLLRPVLNWIKDPTAIKKFQMHFIDPIYIEDTLTHRAKITKKYQKERLNFVECDLWAENQVNEIVTTGSVLFTVPS